MKILIEADRGEGIIFVSRKIATTLSQGKNVIVFSLDNDIIVPCNYSYNLSFYEWEHFEYEMDKYVEKISFSSDISILERFVVIDARYISENILNDFINKISKNIETNFIILKYKQ